MLTKFSLWEEERALVNISMKFWNLPDISWLRRLATRETARIYQFITNNDALFHLRWKVNFLNHQNVSKYCEHDCRFVYDHLWKDWQIVLHIAGTISGLTDSKNWRTSTVNGQTIGQTSTTSGQKSTTRG